MTNIPIQLSCFNGVICGVDVNECKARLDDCHNSECANTAGNFDCVCHLGYESLYGDHACTRKYIPYSTSRYMAITRVHISTFLILPVAIWRSHVHT